MTTYLFVGFVVFFLCYKKYMPQIEKRQRQANFHGSLDVMVDFREFWFMVLIPGFWPLTLPGIFLWKQLEKIYIKYDNKYDE